jgi:SAM-dependent methyltransferase
MLQFLWKVRRLIRPRKTEDGRSAGDHQTAAAREITEHAEGQQKSSAPSVISACSAFPGLTDEEWLDVLIQSVSGADYQGIELPGFPPEEVQKRFVGASGEHALREAFNFYRAIKTYASITPDSRILDFGCGWGRITRFFLKDVFPHRENIFGVDVMPEAIEICRQTKTPGNFILIDNHPPLDFPPESFDLIYAYSVFSHLSEAVSLEWLEEFSRLLKPDGLLVVTTQGRWLIEHCRSLRAREPDQLTPHEQALSNSFLDTEAALADYDQGRFLFSPTGGGHQALAPAVYGEALIPPAYVGRVWTRFFSFRDFVDDPSYLPQAVIVMQKTSPVISVSADNSNKDDLLALTSKDVRLIAFYLPQFHPIPENDLWWGKGFTEWAYVARARPNFEGHHQPRLPADLGFYDLRVPEIREQQAELAREYGIFGFCYYYYWFGGKRLLHRPFDEVLASGRPDFPFCVCWANENWSRRWDGLDQEILIAQNHSPEDDRNFIAGLLPAFRDSRYIRVDGKPLLLVYRVNLLPDAARTAEIWREECRRAGIGDIYLCALESYAGDPRSCGFDAAFEFPPHTRVTNENLISRRRKINPEYQGIIADYTLLSRQATARPAPDYALFRGVMPSWDNTPRRQNDSLVFLNSSPEAYESWLRKAIELTLAEKRGDERMVFINAWNEWAEGAHLEPDQLYGLQYLEATRNAMAIDPRLSNLLQR